MTLPRDLPPPIEWNGLLVAWSDERMQWEIKGNPQVPQECVRAVAMCSFRAIQKQFTGGISGILPAVGTNATAMNARRGYEMWRDAKRGAKNALLSQTLVNRIFTRWR